MSGTPIISAEAFESWPERLRRQGYDVEVGIHDAELGVGQVEKEGKRVGLSLLRSKNGTAAAVLVSGRNAWSRRFVEGIVAVLAEGDATQEWSSRC